MDLTKIKDNVTVKKIVNTINGLIDSFKFATDEEAKTGVATDKIMTPAAVKAVVDNKAVEVMTGATATTAGTAGLVPAPAVGDNDKFLCGDGSYKEAGKVKSVNGQTGDVVVDVGVTSINGQTGALTINTGSSVTVTTGTVPHGGTIPLPSGYTRAQCKYAIWEEQYLAESLLKREFSVNQSTGVVQSRGYYFHNGGSDGSSYEHWENFNASYICIAVK